MGPEDENSLPRSGSSIELSNLSHLKNGSDHGTERKEDKENQQNGGGWTLQIMGNEEIGLDTIQLNCHGFSRVPPQPPFPQSKSLTADESLYSPSSSSWNYSYFDNGDDDKNNTSTSPSPSAQWSLHSSHLLTITHRPRNQAKPSYTNITATDDYLGRVAKSCGCNGTTDGGYSKTSHRHKKGRFEPDIDFIRESYTHEDICKVKYETSLNPIIDGVGRCMMLYVHLKCKRKIKDKYAEEEKKRRTSMDHLKHSKPSSVAVSAMIDNPHFYNPDFEDELIQQEFPEEDIKKNIPGPTREEDDHIILTFAIPIPNGKKYKKQANGNHLNPAPPLLWKVSLPQDPSIAIETLTVLNGTLSTPNTLPSPSHVFINGWQSWSYAGSVPKGAPQPKPALPDMFSLAFNQGATAAPMSRSIDNKWLNSTSLRKKEEDEEYNDTWNSPSAHHYRSDFFTAIISSPSSTTTSTGTPTHTKMIRKDSSHDPYLILGWLSQRNQFGLITMDSNLTDTIAMHCACDAAIIYDPFDLEDLDSSSNTAAAAAAKKGLQKSFTNITDNFAERSETDWAWCQIRASSSSMDHDEDNQEFFAEYMDIVAQHNYVPKSFRNPEQLTVGWCSWYHYYENITKQNLIQNFDALGGLQFDIQCNVAVVDDGYMTAWGDWDSLNPKSFPPPSSSILSQFTQFSMNSINNANAHVMRRISDAIKANGMRPGLWLAPYACDKDSKLAKEHPDWLIYNEQGRIANSANCGKFFYGLDATNPSVREHAFRAIRRAVEDWGFEVLKLDFLYAACLPGNGKYDPSLTRAEIMRLALTNVREAAKPSTFLIGCGCPIGTGIDIMDSMRISADVGPTWYPSFPLPWWDNGTLPSVRGMVRNTINRSMFGFRFWHNDPDCLLLGDGTSITFSELVSVASIIGMTSGMLLLSDDLHEVTAKRMEVAKKIFPVTGATAIPLDLHSNTDGFPSLLSLWCSDRKESRNTIGVADNMGTWNIISMSNWQDKAKTVCTPLADIIPVSDSQTNKSMIGASGYHVFEFWSSKYEWVPTPTINDAAVTLSKKMKAHETEIFHLKAVITEHPQYIGSTIHFSCGFEVKKFKYTMNTVSLRLKNSYRRSGYVFIYIPGHHNNEITATEITEGENGKETKSISPQVVFTLPAFSPKEGEVDAANSMGKIVKIPISMDGQEQRSSRFQQKDGIYTIHF